MKISLWEDGSLKPSSLDALKVSFTHPTWTDIVDPTVEDLEKVADALGIPRYVLIGKLRSNYPHADAYPDYVKIFAWQLPPSTEAKELSSHRNPIVILVNKAAAVTISHSRAGIHDKITERMEEKRLANISVPARVIYLTMMHLLEGYEYLAEQFEMVTEKLDVAIPPWPRDFYMESFNVRKEASLNLRLLRHFRTLVESLMKGRLPISFTEEERQLLDTIYDRTVGAEEMTEMSLEIIKDLIDMHLDTVSHDMNRAMRLIAAITCIVAIPSVVGALLGMNLVDVPWPWQLWQVAMIAFSAAMMLGAYFYKKGWLTGP